MKKFFRVIAVRTSSSRWRSLSARLASTVCSVTLVSGHAQCQRDREKSLELATPYSCLSAIIGSTFIARRAGR
jgi:hypothetical protein